MKFPERIKWSHVRKLYETLAPHLKACPLKIDTPDSGRVLVLAPHIDDDIIGAGGSLRKHVQLGNDVLTIYFADCTEERRREARAVSNIIGFNQLRFLEYRSKTLLEHPEIADSLSAVISDYKPKIVYLPSLFDRHNDHLAINHYLSSLYEKYRYDFTVYAYEVWTALVPNVIVDITATMNEKKKALAQYASQLASQDWLDAAVSLNRYRAITSGAGQYAEGFMRYSMKEYFTLWKAVYAG
ncbi:MAG: PIG-L deacetylase family protein [Thermodesulfovibrionales bacterium]|jgi:LmbE family N-acetylglucosaminyl deacetylase